MLEDGSARSGGVSVMSTVVALHHCLTVGCTLCVVHCPGTSGHVCVWGGGGGLTESECPVVCVLSLLQCV